MNRAGYHALKEGMQSHASIATMANRWSQFVQYAQKELGIRDMRQIEKVHLQQYAAQLREQFDHGELKSATTQNYLSAVNRVMEIARGDKTVHLDPVREAGLPRRSGICTESRAVSPEAHQHALGLVSERIGVLLNLQREFGLRFEESAKLDAAKALTQAERNGSVRILDGTKGGRLREVPITRPEPQLAALRAAARVQGEHHSLIPAAQTYAAFRGAAYREIAPTGIHFHGERHSYAQERYQVLIGAPCPVVAGVSHREHHHYLSQTLQISAAEARERDHAARLQVALEVGHGRIDITNNYLG
ncbi:hypothetical protein GCM10011502_30020 [Oceanisphaera marina]|uniref:Core-binding (CB) domain-containing protein n=2 Tax=Oceanisphaera marina TaxID=2017550 RepID=A0ABQ1IXT7_9GAMM|nr:hypothetical protein GCM10011502_30020 [Oceanisphaera marina]